MLYWIFVIIIIAVFFPKFKTLTGWNRFFAGIGLLIVSYIAYLVILGLGALIISSMTSPDIKPTQVKEYINSLSPTSQPLDTVMPTIENYNEISTKSRGTTLYQKSYLTSTSGYYKSLPDFEANLAMINWHQYYPSGETPRAFFIRADTTWESASLTPDAASTGCGFVFNEKDQKNYYAVYLALDGQVYLIRRQNDVIDAQWYEPYGKVAIPKGSALLELTVQDGNISFFVDAEPVLSVNDSKVNGRTLGFAIFSGTNKDFGTRCKMKNIDLWILD